MANEVTDHAHELLAHNRYVVLGTVGDDGRAWTTPVYFASSGRDLYWVSDQGAVHSRNLAARPDLSLVVFDSSVPPYHGRAFYAVGTASVVEGDDLEAGLEAYPGHPSRGGSQLGPESVSGASEYRLYRVTADEAWVLCPREPQQPCPLHGRDEDHREQVEW